MNLREAAQMALEALEWHLKRGAWGADIEGVTEALRAALAEPEPQPVAWWDGNSKFAIPKAKDWDKRTGGTTAFGCDIPLYTAPTPQPVAHKHEWFSTGAMKPGQIRCIHCGVWNHEAAPTPRKPLTGEEIEVLWQNTSPYYDHQDFARAIEAAHGIGEQT